MNCLCCGKPLQSNTDCSGWHKACINSFFGTSVIPEIHIDDRTLQMLALESTQKGVTVPGVQKKLSLHLLSTDNNPRLTIVNYPTGYILKPQVSDYPYLPESEHLVMSMADACGLITVPHALIEQNGMYAYITRRVDRIFGDSHVGMLAMEDFCQLDGRLAQDKYKGSYECCAKVIRKFSSQVGYDLTEFFMRVVFCFITGNSDMHLKNFSLIETEEESNEYILSPAYDLLPVSLIMPEDTEEMALTLNGKKKRIRKSDFLAFAESCQISAASAEKMIRMLVSKKQKLLDLCATSLLPEPMKTQCSNLIETRISLL